MSVVVTAFSPAFSRFGFCALLAFALTGCQGEAGRPGNPGPQGDPGPTGAVGAAGPVGPTGPVGATGMPGQNGMNGQDGTDGTQPVFMSNPFSGILQYSDGTAVLEIGAVTVVAPADGQLFVRGHFSGTVIKRAGAVRCRVEVALRKDREIAPYLLQNLGVFDAPIADRYELSVAATLAGPLAVTAGQRVTVRLEIRRFDDECADGQGGTPIAQLFGQLDLAFSQAALQTE